MRQRQFVLQAKMRHRQFSLGANRSNSGFYLFSYSFDNDCFSFLFLNRSCVYLNQVLPNIDKIFDVKLYIFGKKFVHI